MLEQFRQIQSSLSRLYEESEARSIARLVLEVGFGIDYVSIVAGKDKQFSPEESAKLDMILHKLQSGIPVQYALGVAEFGALTLKVTPDVLIPRPETEELVDWICSDYQEREGIDILDIGTGSGCIAISLATRLRACIDAWDISQEALQVATANAARCKAAVRFSLRDALQSSSYSEAARYDIVVSNPPYIADAEKVDMESNVLDHEPELALFVPDDDVLKFYRAIASGARNLLKPGGTLYFEINSAHGQDTAALLQSMGYKGIELRQDFTGRDRMVKASYGTH